MTENYHKWLSQYINKEFEMLVFGTGGIPVIYFPPAKERYYAAKDYGFIESAAELINDEIIKIYCPDTYNQESWYNFSAPPVDRINNYKNFEQLIIHDIVAFAKYETKQDKIILAGSEFGGYHVLNFTLKHPDMVSGLVSLSGFFDIRQFIFGFYNDDCYFNNPPEYLPGLIDKWYIDNLKKMFIAFGCSSSGYSLDESRHISSLLSSKGIKNILDIRESDDGWKLWGELFNNFIRQIIKNQK